jgi:hypothetical protein
MTDTKQYPKTLEAAQTAERSGYDVAKALWEEVEKTDSGKAKQGEIQRVREYLTKNSLGDTYSTAWLSRLHSLGGWVFNSSYKPSMPPRMAMEAIKANLSTKEAEAQWELGPDKGDAWTSSLRAIASVTGTDQRTVQRDLAARKPNISVTTSGAAFAAGGIPVVSSHCGTPTHLNRHLCPPDRTP